jgi:putative transposase
MKLSTKIKLLPTLEQTQALTRTIERANAACDWISKHACQSKTYGQYALHHLCYAEARRTFGLSAQMIVRCIAKVADAYKLDQRTRRKFKPTGSIAYDDRILSWQLGNSSVSIWTVDGRLRIPFVCGERQRELLHTRQGESDLTLFRDKFFLAATCEIEAPATMKAEGVLGVDLGVTNIAVDSDGQAHPAKTMNGSRHRHRRLRAKLQRAGSHMAKRRLKTLSGRERRFATWVNHNISKQIVEKAKGTRRAIALEDLQGIRGRITARRSQRATLHRWSFHQLQSFIRYKAQKAGIAVIVIDPRNSSRTCPNCGHVDKANRKSQSQFSCVVCGHAGQADHFAALEIARRAVVNQPSLPRLLEHQQEGQGKAAPLAAR